MLYPNSLSLSTTLDVADIDDAPPTNHFTILYGFGRGQAYGYDAYPIETIRKHWKTKASKRYLDMVSDIRKRMLEVPNAYSGTVPSLVKKWKSSRCIDGLDWSNIS